MAKDDTTLERHRPILEHLLRYAIVSMGSSFGPKENRGDGQKRIKPTSCLIDGLTDEICRELSFKLPRSQVRVAPLRKWHATRIKPAIDDILDPLHASTIREG